VENAIRHGIRYLEDRKGLITISLEQEADVVVCNIDDNGVGRSKAAELKSAMHIEYQSRGMQLSSRRAELYNIKQTVTDKKATDGTATGTTITLKIPASLKP
jgi:LytS/YehU family sensor histidine kinase